eukprot:TRINITY_DN28059_c0_g1_i1.p1 TRINITY_DN28059_c0_g1~~TRINITY_DN28059_c0_g1_i1.p1  ORF type:complete len:1318 (+),score=215.35 TRINITY_DN28059_c0_g1_i1:59-4012(+)
MGKRCMKQGLNLRIIRKVAAQEDAVPPTPGSSPRDTADEEALSMTAAACVDNMFRLVKSRSFYNPKRWRRLFLTAAAKYEVRLDILREELYVAVSLDDTDDMLRVKALTSEKLWNFWAYDLNFVTRATNRYRTEQLEILPELFGDEFPGLEEVQRRREALDYRPPKQSQQDLLEKQRGEVLIGIVRRAFEKMQEIDIRALKDELDSIESGQWRDEDSVVPARGVNYGAPWGDYGGWRPLHFIAANHYAKETAIEAAKLLIEARINCNLPDAAGYTALHTAASHGHTAIVEVILENGCGVEARDKNGCTALIHAARTRNSDIVRTILRWVLPAEVVDEILDTEHERAAQRFSLSNGVKMHRKVADSELHGAQFLIEKGDGNGDNLADVNFADSLGKRTLHVAVSSISSDAKCVETLQMLVKLRADLDMRTLDSGETALHMAARLLRAPVVRSLLRLKAHPGITDRRGRTPLMLAALSPDQVREPVPYEGVLINKATSWQIVQDILDWDGEGTPPGPQARKCTGPAADHVPEILNRGLRDQLAKVRKPPKPASPEGEDDEEGEEDDDEVEDETEEDAIVDIPASTAKAYKSEQDTFMTKANAIISLGFDDQRIMDTQGKINRGDRLQLSKAFFQVPRGSPSGTPPQPNEKRVRSLWRLLTYPLLQLESRGMLQPRHSDLLKYCLVTTLGRRGPTFAALVGAGIGTKVLALPSWEVIEETLSENEDLQERSEALRKLCFRGSKPKRQCWVGACWDFGDHPREPENAPWYAFRYVDVETADFINSRAGKPPLSDEAFKGNDYTPFEPLFIQGVVGGEAVPPHRGEMLRLGDRLNVDETIGRWNTTEEAFWDRTRTVGNFLLCPLLLEAIRALSDEAAKENAAKTRDLLRYVVVQMYGVQRTLDRPRHSYREAWAEVHREAVKALFEDVAPSISSRRIPPLPCPAPEIVSMWDKNRPKVTLSPAELEWQASCLPQKDLRWLQKRQTAAAYIELVRSRGVHSTEDFNEIVIALSWYATAESLNECFWRAAFGLLLRGRAESLLAPLTAELTRRLRKARRRVMLHGPRLMPRSALLGAAAAAGGAVLGAVAAAGQANAATVETNISKVVVQSNSRDQAIGANICHECGARYWQPDSLTIARWCMRCGEERRPPRNRVDPENEPPPVPLIPGGFTDVIKSEVVCRNEDDMWAVLEVLLEPPPTRERSLDSVDGIASSQKTNVASAGEDEVELRAVRVISDFHGSRSKDVLPRARGILIILELRSKQMVQGEPLRQLIEVELLFESTSEARWLASVVGITPADAPPPPAAPSFKRKKKKKASETLL